jgi:hypothetical protein
MHGAFLEETGLAPEQRIISSGIFYVYRCSGWHEVLDKNPFLLTYTVLSSLFRESETILPFLPEGHG